MHWIREAVWPRDEAAALGFIMGSQHFEHAIEPNRRLDAPVAGEHLKVLKGRVAENGGKFFVVEGEDGEAAGWGVVYLQDDDVFVVPTERRFAYVAELFVIEALRGQGAGRALIAACEDWGRSQGAGLMQIGVLPGNARAAGIYRRAGYSDYGLQLRKYLR
ncbi:MAG TPA: GNAT family N-acetyltransferase [Rhizomicrobium sp.]|nr:GNAT family N-acetyltransferase [Rhizomicrobium sp.]